VSRALGIIDVGSNTVRLAVYSVEGPSGACRLLTARREVLRLAREGRHLDDGAVARTAAVLSRFRRICQDYGANEIVAAATAAVRQADNGQGFVAAVQAKTGVECRILDGDTEAEMGFRGGLANLAITEGLLVDVGGASTEASIFHDRRMGSHASVPVGAVNGTTRWLSQDPPGRGEVRAMRSELAAVWAGMAWLEEARGLPLVGIGGTFRALAKIFQRRHGRREPLHGTEVPATFAADLLGELAAMPPARRAAVPGLPAHRADIIVAGMAIVAELAARTGAELIIVSGQGLREGLLLEAIRPGGDGADQPVPDPFGESLRSCVALFRLSPGRSSHVAAVALQLFDGTTALHNLGKPERRAVEVAGRLRDAGTAIDYYARDKHTFYLIRNAPLHGLTRRERDLAAAAGAYEKLGGHRERWAETGAAPGDETVAARLGLLVALADALADSQPQPAQTPLHVTATPAIVRVCAPDLGAGEGASLTHEFGEEFRRLFGRPLAFSQQG